MQPEEEQIIPWRKKDEFMAVIAKPEFLAFNLMIIHFEQNKILL